MTGAVPSVAAPPAPKADRRSAAQRPSSDTSRFHMSKEAVDRSVEELFQWSDLKCVKHLAVIRWGDFKRVTCPHCNTSTDHYWTPRELRWKCKSCASRFSVTSQTVFANRRMPLQKLLAGLHLWACGAAGQPALELRRMLKFGGYNTAFTMGSKLREGLQRGFNIGLVSGVIEIDAAHASGRRASEKRSKPLSYSVKSEEEAQTDAMLTTSARQKKRRDDKAAALAAGGVVHPEHGQVFPATRRLVHPVRCRSGVKGRGALVTRVGVGLTESPQVAEALATAFVAIPESILATDTGTAFIALGKKFQAHCQVNHSETLMGPEGQHNNNAESFSARQDRSEKGVYLNIEPKYLTDYAVETAFREDHRRMAPGAVADQLLGYALSVGLSHHWRGFTHGRHRKHEILITGNRPAKASGPEKGRSPISSVNGRPSR